MEKLYIKYIKGDDESLNKAVNIAKSLGYKEHIAPNALRHEGYGILVLEPTGVYYTTHISEKNTIDNGYKEYIHNLGSTSLSQYKITKQFIVDELKFMSGIGLTLEQAIDVLSSTGK